MASGCRIDVSSEEVMHRDIPFSRELEPITGVPPVGVEVPVGEAGYLRESAKKIFEDDEEDEQEGNHEREQKP